MNLHKEHFRADELRLIKRAASSKAMGIGDVVQLNSGGPHMIVVDFGDKGRVSTAWLIDGCVTEAEWPHEALNQVGLQSILSPSWGGQKIYLQIFWVGGTTLD